jgi:DNA-binding GntR family transcriptional regulator
MAIKRKIVTLSMREQIYDALHDMILKNNYGPNAVLQIDHLAEEFGVSATPVREALVRLEADGLVSLIPNKGAQVTDIQGDDIRYNWEMRRLLEPYAANQSATLIPDDEISVLKAETLSLRGEGFDKDRYVDADTKLHEILYIHLDNACLKDIIRRVHKMSTRIRYFPEGSSAMHESVVNEVIQENCQARADPPAERRNAGDDCLGTNELNGEDFFHSGSLILFLLALS